MLRAYIKDFKSGDVLLNQSFGLVLATKKLGKTGNEYYDIVLADKTGQIDAKIWSNSFGDCLVNKLSEGIVVEIVGKVDSFNDKLQVIIEKLKILEEYDPSQFIYSGERNKEEIWNYLMTEVNSLEDIEIKSLILKIFSDVKIVNSFKSATAAEYVHHDFVGGLLEHVYEMAKVAKLVKELYIDVNYSELLFGILFHDIGKIEEFRTSGVTLTRTKSGYLLGHIVQGLLFLNSNFDSAFNSDKKDRLMHMIASHHGQKEFGSPTQPATIEAIMLSQIDDLSSKAGIFYTHKRGNIADNMGFLGYNKYLGSNLMQNNYL